MRKRGYGEVSNGENRFTGEKELQDSLILIFDSHYPRQIFHSLGASRFNSRLFVWLIVSNNAFLQVMMYASH
jgi:hypothetical protein